MKNTKFNKRNFIPRIIVSPFILAILLISHNLFVIKRFWHFLKFGGEYINFEQNERATIQDIYDQLKKQNEMKPLDEQYERLCRGEITMSEYIDGI